MSQTLKVPMTHATAAPVPEVAPPSVLTRLLRETGYNLLAFVVAVPAFVLAVTLLSTGLGLIVIVGGFLLLTLGVYVARGFARAERTFQRELLGREVASPAYLCPREGDGFLRRVLLPLRDPQSWLDVGWSILSLVTGTVAFSLTVAWWSATLGGLSYWFWQQFIPYDPQDNTTLAELMGFGEGRTPEIVLNLTIGLAAAVTLPFVVRLAATVHAGLARVLLGSRAELQAEVDRVESGRDAARRAEADSLRRLERDIHDGPQQRLVRLAMDLGRARKQLDQDDPERVRETLDTALLQARETVDELRSLSRGIAPPLLVDRGLRAAIEELLVRSLVPVDAHVEVPEELPPHVETAVYFVVAEAMTNVAKHSGARHARVDVAETEDAAGGRMIAVRVEDDGAGGAHPAKGRGLAGVQQRLAGVDGVLDLASPPGGPTVLTARIPVRGT